MGPTWVLSARDGPHVGPMNLAIRVDFFRVCGWSRVIGWHADCNIPLFVRLMEAETYYSSKPLLWRHNGQGSVSNHQPHDCLLNRLFKRRPKKTPMLRGNSPGTGEFPAQMASNAENVSIWWRHHASSEPYRWLSARLRSLHCVSNGVTTVLH